MQDAILQMLSLWQSVAAALLIGTACAALGVLCVLRRAIFIGIALAEMATLGVAVGLLAGLPPLLCAGALSVATGLSLSPPFEQGRLPRDAVLGVIFVGAAALSILLVSGSAIDLHDIKAQVYGDLLLAGTDDLFWLLICLAPVMIVFASGFRHILFSFADRDMARVLGVRVRLWDALYFAMLALAVAVAARLAGALLVFAYVAIPAATALLLSRRIAVVMMLAPSLAVFSTLAGLLAAFVMDWPLNPAIAGTMCAVLALAAGWRKLAQPGA